MEIMRSWSMSDTQTSVQAKTFTSDEEFTLKNDKHTASILIDPKEGTSKQINQTIYSGPTAKKTPSTPECEEVLEELRKKYYNPREGSSKQMDYSNLMAPNKTPTICKPEVNRSVQILYETYKKRFVSPQNQITICESSGEDAMELLRSCVQCAFDKEVDFLVKKFVQLYFVPAMKNLKENLGENAISDEIICSICLSLIENSKAQYLSNLSSADTQISEAASLSTATTPKMELSESDSSDNSSHNNFMGSILHQALKRKRIDESSCTFMEEETNGEEISDDLLGKIAEEISEEDLSQAFSFEDSMLSDIPCLSLSPPPLIDVLNTDTTDFKVPLPPIETIKGVCAPFSSLFVPSNTLVNDSSEQCFDFIDFDFIE
ncbi:uncharacterized protein LOC134831880 [Culicoides brevitarsis]|uniref:uncharacterized protein LOC134831880 n=1 Tax=Culicoides brevitarsis TaxID=469753 RepID=UPI00307C4AF1